MFEVFTTILVINGKPCWPKQHLARLDQHAKQIGLKMPPVPDLKTGDLKKHLLRLSLNKQGYEIKIRELKAPTPKDYQKGVLVYLSNQIATSQIKTNQRQAYDLAYKQAQEHNAFEGLLLNQEGYLVDGSRTSLLLMNKNTLTILEGGIEGITRNQIALSAQKLGFEIKRAYLKPHQLSGQLFLAGTGVGLIPVQNLVGLK